MNVFDGIRTPLVPSIEPGSSQTYEIKIAAPPEPGDYRLRVILVQEGIRWFDELPQTNGFCDLSVSVP